MMLFLDYDLEVIDLKNQKSIDKIKNFLAQFDLSFDPDVEYTVALSQEGRLVATGSFVGEILRNIAVDENLQGFGLTSTIITQLIQELARQGRHHYFIFTKPVNAHLFKQSGFQEIARAEPYAALLEAGIGSVESYCASIAKDIAYLPENRASIVVNCNPFTNGHRALIEQAAREYPGVIVFVVSEDRSLFPFSVRMQLVQVGLADLDNVAVLPAGRYIISAATFPTYFTREENITTAQTRLDIMLFATQIAPRLGIISRYVGTEPYCSITNAYNQAMLDILPRYGIKVIMIQRAQAGTETISASKVRDMIKSGDWEGVRHMVPSSTYNYLISDVTKDIIEKIRHSASRH